MSGYAFVPFSSWAHLLDAVSAGYTIYYHAPLDYQPNLVQVVVRRDGKLRVTPVYASANPFTADEGHLNRFVKRVVTT